MRHTNILYFLICFLSLGCEELTTIPSSTKNIDLIVVDGIITNEKINHKIKLTHSYLKQNENAAPVSGAVVSLIEDTVVFDLTETPAGSGEYYTPQIRAATGKIYTLSIIYNGKEYRAQDSPVPVEPLTPITYRNNNGSYELTFHQSGQNPSFIAYDINWENTPACALGSSCKGKLVFYDLKNIDVNEIYKPGKEEFTFPVNTTIIRKKYSVSAAYKTFLRSMLSETEWRGGVFDVQRADVPTNLSEGAVGFFAVSTVVADTTIVN